MTRARILTILLVTLSIGACGRPASMVVTPRNAQWRAARVTLLPVRVTSSEPDAEQTALNDQWKEFAATELRSLMANKGYATSESGDADVACDIHIDYGSRALRYFIGFGAGSGHVQVAIKLVDQSGTARYATKTEADLSIGAFGGDMTQVVRSAIREAVEDFGSRL